MKQTGPRDPGEPIRDPHTGSVYALDGAGLREMGKFPAKRASRKRSEAQLHYMRRRSIKPGGKEV